MKKVLLVLGVAIAFAACSSTNDCTCTVSSDGDTSPAIPMNKWDGKCSTITLNDLPGNWATLFPGGTVNCK